MTRPTDHPRPGGSLAADTTYDTQGWRAEVLNTMLRIVLVLGTLTAIPSIVLSIQVGLPALAIVDVIAVVWIAVVALRTDIPYRWRAGSLLAVVYLLGAALLVTVGVTSQIYLMAVPALTALLLGLRPGIAALAISSLTLFTVGYLVDARLSIPGLEREPLLEWTVIALNFAFVAAIITISTAVLLDRLERSVTRASRLARAVEQAREGIVIGDAEGRIAYANAAFATMTGVERNSLLRLTLADVPLRTAEGASLVEAIEAVGDRKGRLLLTRADDPTVVLEAVASPMADAAGDVRGRVVVLRDLTGERQMEARLRQSERLEALGTLAGGVAHDFNNIIGSILAVAEASREETTDDRLRENLDRIVLASHRAREIVRRMLAFSRRSEPDRRPIPVKAIVDEAVPLLRAALPANIDLRAQAVTDAAVVADPSELHQILMNLATNAAQAMAGKGGGTLSIQVTSVVPDTAFATLHPAVRAGAPYVHLSVTDTGSGIERAVLERIFEPFFTTKPGQEGTGLGLATVHGIVTSLGGAIDVYSEVGHGATFRAYLPQAAVTAASVSDSPMQAAPPVGGSGRILVVDDEEAIRTMTERLLVRLGYHVATAPDGLAAEQAFREDPAAFDLLLTDLTMPGLGGAGLIRAIHDVRPDMPAILTSGFSDSMRDDERAALVPTSFLQKPYTQAELARLVATALGHTTS